LAPAVRGRYVASVQVACDLAEALAGRALYADAVHDLGRKGYGPSGRAWLASPLARRTLPLADESLELIDRDELRSPRHLDGLDVREDAPVEGRATDAERIGRLRAGVGEPLDARRLAHDRWRLRAPAFLLDAAASTAA